MTPPSPITAPSTSLMLSTAIGATSRSGHGLGVTPVGVNNSRGVSGSRTNTLDTFVAPLHVDPLSDDVHCRIRHLPSAPTTVNWLAAVERMSNTAFAGTSIADQFAPPSVVVWIAAPPKHEPA